MPSSSSIERCVICKYEMYIQDTPPHMDRKYIIKSEIMLSSCLFLFVFSNVLSPVVRHIVCVCVSQTWGEMVNEEWMNSKYKLVNTKKVLRIKLDTKWRLVYLSYKHTLIYVYTCASVCLYRLRVFVFVWYLKSWFYGKYLTLKSSIWYDIDDDKFCTKTHTHTIFSMVVVYFLFSCDDDEI